MHILHPQWQGTKGAGQQGSGGLGQLATKIVVSAGSKPIAATRCVRACPSGTSLSSSFLSHFRSGRVPCLRGCNTRLRPARSGSNSLPRKPTVDRLRHSCHLARLTTGTRSDRSGALSCSAPSHRAVSGIVAAARHCLRGGRRASGKIRRPARAPSSLVWTARSADLEFPQRSRTRFDSLLYRVCGIASAAHPL